MHWTSIYFPDKELVFAMAKIVTARKTREENLEMLFRKQENLASHFKEKLEGDKRSLARELHDELAQLATAIKTEINWLGQQPCLEEQAQQRADRTSVLLDLLINSIRRISYAISPTMLDDVGLFTPEDIAAAVEGHLTLALEEVRALVEELGDIAADLGTEAKITEAVE